LVEVVQQDQHPQQEAYKVQILVFLQLIRVKILGVKVVEEVVVVLQKTLLVHVSVVQVVQVVAVLNVMVVVGLELLVRVMVVVLVAMDLVQVMVVAVEVLEQAEVKV
jgi:hypothetical protein